MAGPPSHPRTRTTIPRAPRLFLLAAACVLMACVPASAQILSGPVVGRIKQGGRGPLPPPPPVAPLGDLTPDLFTAGSFVDLTTFGGPKVGISKELLQALQDNLSSFFLGLPGPSLPIDLFYSAMADKWTTTLVKFQYSPGIQGFLDYFVPGGSVIQDKLLKATCTIYPWTPQLPPPVHVLKDSYCAKAIPANILSHISQGLPLPQPPFLP